MHHAFHMHQGRHSSLTATRLSTDAVCGVTDTSLHTQFLAMSEGLQSPEASLFMSGEESTVATFACTVQKISAK